MLRGGKMSDTRGNSFDPGEIRKLQTQMAVGGEVRDKACQRLVQMLSTLSQSNRDMALSMLTNPD